MEEFYNEILTMEKIHVIVSLFFTFLFVLYSFNTKLSSNGKETIAIVLYAQEIILTFKGIICIFLLAPVVKAYLFKHIRYFEPSKSNLDHL
jgi:hypothetical protein